MTHTSPDYTSKWKNRTVFSAVDNGELAARLGSIDTFDRRGNIVWMDDFESAVLNWEPFDDSGGALHVLTAERKLNGNQSLKITTDVGALDQAGIDKKLAYPVQNKIGVELASTVVANTGSPLIELWLYDGVHRHEARMVYNIVGDRISIWSHLGGWVEAQTGFYVNDDDWMFNIMKLVVDFETGYYARCILNDQTVDLSQFRYESVLDGTNPHLWIRYWYYARVIGGITNYVDNVIVTQNEV